MSEEKVPGTEHLAAALDTETLVKMFLSETVSEAARFDTLDAKAGLILGFGLVSIAEMVGFLLLAVADGHSPGAGVPLVVQLLFYLGMGCLMAGTTFAMLALYPRNFARDASIITEKVLTTVPTVFDVLNSVLNTKHKIRTFSTLKANGPGPGEFSSSSAFCALLWLC